MVYDDPLGSVARDGPTTQPPSLIVGLGDIVRRLLPRSCGCLPRGRQESADQFEPLCISCVLSGHAWRHPL